MTANIEAASRLYDAFAARDAGALLAALHPSFAGVVSAGMPLGVGGRHEGPEVMLAEVWAPVFTVYDVVPEADELLLSGSEQLSPSALTGGRFGPPARPWTPPSLTFCASTGGE